MRQPITHNGQEIGYIEYVTAADELQIIDIFVQAEYRQRGLAEEALRGLLAAHPASAQVYLEVRASNQPALNLYAKLGFTKCGLRKGYYSNPTEDAVLMERKLF